MCSEILDVQQMIGQNYEPKRKFRWIMEIDGIDSFTCKSASRPSFTTDSIEIGYINATRFVAGKTKPGTISLTLIDSIDPSASQKVMEWVRLHYDASTGRAAYQNFYKRDITLKSLGPVGDVVEQWTGHGVFITEANFGDLDYTAGDAMEISLTLQADFWVQEF
jgi:hypothetical protein